MRSARTSCTPAWAALRALLLIVLSRSSSLATRSTRLICLSDPDAPHRLAPRTPIAWLTPSGQSLSNQPSEAWVKRCSVSSSLAVSSAVKDRLCSPSTSIRSAITAAAASASSVSRVWDFSCARCLSISACKRAARKSRFRSARSRCCAAPASSLPSAPPSTSPIARRYAAVSLQRGLSEKAARRRKNVLDLRPLASFCGMAILKRYSDNNRFHGDLRRRFPLCGHRKHGPPYTSRSSASAACSMINR